MVGVKKPVKLNCQEIMASTETKEQGKGENILKLSK